MKKANKGLLITAAILLGTGIVATAAGLMMGARFNDTEFGLVDIGPNGIVVAGNDWSNESLPALPAPPALPDAPTPPAPPALPGVASVGSNDWRGTINESYSGNIDTVSISVGPSKAVIREGDTFSIVADGDNVVRFRSYVQNNEWVIENETSRKIDLKNADVSVTITVPKGWVAEDWDIEIGMGSLQADYIRGNTVDLTVGMGAIAVGVLESTDTTLECDMGQLTVDRATITGETDLECGMGQLTMTIVGSESNYGAELNVGMGSVEVGSHQVGGMGGSLTYNLTSPNLIEGNCGMGQIIVGFTE